MSPLEWHDIRLRLAIRLGRPILAGLLVVLFLIAAGLVGSNDLEDEQLAAQIVKAPR